MRKTATVMDEGGKALLGALGVLETELFISTLLKEPFNYTEWRKTHFAEIDIDPSEFNQKAVEYDRANPPSVIPVPS
ncbi:MAG: hypothetical protein FWB78_07200 [Treponema sp.]|nr:hypothetical protein [Treponema sp.]